MPGTLYGLDYSPWSERARWALDHHRVQHRFVQHLPLLGEPLLRWRARNSGRATASVPLFVDGSGSYGDSWEIMKRAERVGAGHALFTDTVSCERVYAMVEPALLAGRARVVMSTLASRQALADSARAVAPGPLTPLLRPVSAFGARFLSKKYGAQLDSIEARDRVIETVLEGLRAELRGHPYLVGERFSAADIVAAGLMQVVKPVAAAHISLMPSIEACWTSERLASRFGDLLEWRDDVYAEHRRRVA